MKAPHLCSAKLRRTKVMSVVATSIFFVVNIMVSLAASLTSSSAPIWTWSNLSIFGWLAYSIVSSLVCGHLYSVASCIDEMICLYSLFEACTKSAASRKQFYSLSYPGGHPRMWTLLKNTSCRYIDVVHDKLECATYSRQRDNFSTERYHQSAHVLEDSSNTTPISCKLALDGNEDFFVPPALNRRKNVIAASFERQTPLNYFRKMCWMGSPVLSLYETFCATFAIRSLTSLVSNSLVEDQYGVVQKDLRPIIVMLTRLSITIDAHIRSVQSFKQGFDANVRYLDETLTDSLRKIYDVFREYITALDLHPVELEVLQTLCITN